MYNDRQFYKEQKNAVEQIFKLMLNSGYGKCIESDHDSETYIVDIKDYDKFLGSHYDALLESTKISETKMKIKIRKEC